jgi:hypothetical protein
MQAWLGQKWSLEFLLLMFASMSPAGKGATRWIKTSGFKRQGTNRCSLNLSCTNVPLCSKSERPMHAT